MANASEMYLPLVSHLLELSPVDQLISAARLTAITNVSEFVLSSFDRGFSEFCFQLVALNPPLSHSILDRMAEMRKECMFATRIVCERLDDEAVSIAVKLTIITEYPC